MDILTTGYRCLMQTWADESHPPTEVVWFRVPAGTPFFSKPSLFRSRNFIGSKAENAKNFDVGERNLVDTDCSRSFRIPWYRGNFPANYTGLVHCGSDLVAQYGGNAVVNGVPITPNTPIIQTRADGSAACCEPLFLVALGGEAEGSQPVGQVVIPVQVVNHVVPLVALIAAKNTIDQNFPLPFAGGTPIEWGFAVGPPFQYGEWGITSAPAQTLFAPYDGIYRIEVVLPFNPLSAPMTPGTSDEVQYNVGVTLFPSDLLFTLRLHASAAHPHQWTASGSIVTPILKGIGISVGVSGGNLTTGEQLVLPALTGTLSITMIAPLTVVPGATGVCTANTVIGSGSAAVQVNHVHNDTFCPGPAADIGGGPGASAGDDVAIPPDRAAGPGAGAGDSASALGGHGAGPGAGAGDSTDTFTTPDAGLGAGAGNDS